MKRSKSFSIQTRRQPSRQKTKAQSRQKVIDKRPTTHSKKEPSIYQQIKIHIDKHLDVEIIIYYEQYKEQFFLKCKRLQNFLYINPSIKSKYLNQDDSHFKSAFTFLMLDLYRKGIIVPGSHDNLRVEAVTQLQNWMLSWVQRKLLYEKYKEDQKQSIITTCSVLSELEDYVKIIQVEQLPF